MTLKRGSPLPPKAAVFISGLLCLIRLLFIWSWDLLPSFLYPEVQALSLGLWSRSTFFHRSEPQIFEDRGSSPGKTLLKSYSLGSAPGLVLKKTKQVHMLVTLAVSAAPSAQHLTTFVDKFQIPKRPSATSPGYLGQSWGILVISVFYQVPQTRWCNPAFHWQMSLAMKMSSYTICTIWQSWGERDEYLTKASALHLSNPPNPNHQHLFSHWPHSFLPGLPDSSSVIFFY